MRTDVNGFGQRVDSKCLLDSEKKLISGQTGNGTTEPHSNVHGECFLGNLHN
jgi:hypothetical protein